VLSNQLSQLEHVLKRPDTYIGSVEAIRQFMWIYDKEKKAMVNKEISFVPGLYKIVDEILVNAADNKVCASEICPVPLAFIPVPVFLTPQDSLYTQ
jgi:DNA gyrase/topoisomerase IV subunit B